MSVFRERQPHTVPDFSTEGTQEITPEDRIRSLSSPGIALSLTRINDPLSDDFDLWRETMFELQEEFNDYPELLGTMHHHRSTNGVMWNTQIIQFFGTLSLAEAIDGKASVHNGSCITGVAITDEGKELITKIYGERYKDFDEQIDKMASLIQDRLSL